MRQPAQQPTTRAAEIRDFVVLGFAYLVLARLQISSRGAS